MYISWTLAWLEITFCVCCTNWKIFSCPNLATDWMLTQNSVVTVLDLVCWSPTEQVPDSSTVHKYIFSWSQRNMVLAIKKLMLTHKNILSPCRRILVNIFIEHFKNCHDTKYDNQFVFSKYSANFTISRWVIIYVFPTITPISDQVALCRLAVSQTRPCDAVNEGIKLC